MSTTLVRASSSVAAAARRALRLGGGRCHAAVLRPPASSLPRSSAAALAGEVMERAAPPAILGGMSWHGFASSSAEGEGTGDGSSCVMDVCNLNIVSSPFPPIQPPPYEPLAEFVTADWRKSDSLRDKVAIVDGTTGQNRTFCEYDRAMGSIAASLSHGFGISEDSTVCLFSPNHVDYVPVTLAVSLTGAKMTPVNPLYTSHELSHILERSRTDVLIAHERLLDVAREAVSMVKGGHAVREIIVIPSEDGGMSGDAPDGITSLEELKRHANPLRRTVHAVHQDVSVHPFLLPYSSGTTGLPKGVCLSHQNLVCNLLQMDEVEGMSFPSDHKVISPLPFFHIYGFLVSALYTAWRGQQVITFSGRFDLELFCKLVEEHKPQRAHLVPPILIGLAKHPLVDKFDLSSLSMAVSAAAPLGADTEQAVMDRLDIEIKQAWGMSELSPIGTLTSDYNVKSGSVGPLVSSTYGKVIDQAGKSLGPNETGELMIKGPQVMMGYLDAPDKTAECLSKDGWLRTGDVAHYDEDGFFFITDRLKELIKVRGYPVAPAELEALLLTNPRVQDAAVIPTEDEVSGELPRAYVVLKEGEEMSKTTEDDIAAWVKERVAPHKRLAGGVIFTEEIPKSASGKILRRILVDLDRHGAREDDE